MMSSLTGIAGENVVAIGNNGIYTEEEISNLINNEGYIPVATANELELIGDRNVGLSGNLTKDLTFGQGTKWSGLYDSAGWSGKYIQVADIDLAHIDNFTPIGLARSATAGESFQGDYDGGGFTISNLSVDRGSGTYAGLFGRIHGATLKNIKLLDVDIKGHMSVGGLVGTQQSSIIMNNYVSGNVVGVDRVGGLIGWSTSSSSVDSSGWNIESHTGEAIGLMNGGSTMTNTSSYTTSEINDIINNLF